LKIASLVMVVLLLSPMMLANNLVSAKPGPIDPPEGSAPIPNAGTATINGNPSEWDTTIPSNDYFAPMYEAGKLDKDILARAYVRYDVETETCYVLVLSINGQSVEKKSSEAWIAINGVSNKVITGSSTSFKWVPAPGSTTRVIGYEASFHLKRGNTYTIIIHCDVWSTGDREWETARIYTWIITPVPESPLGSFSAIIAMVAALVGFFALRKPL
jgi:hypothetical protein